MSFVASAGMLHSEREFFFKALEKSGYASHDEAIKQSKILTRTAFL